MSPAEYESILIIWVRAEQRHYWLKKKQQQQNITENLAAEKYIQ